MRHEPRPISCKLTTISVETVAKAASNDSIETEKKRNKKNTQLIRALHFGQVFHNSFVYICFSGILDTSIRR